MGVVEEGDAVHQLQIGYKTIRDVPRAALHHCIMHSIPFDVVSKMYTGMLKPLIFDQNELEYHSTLDFWRNPWTMYTAC